MNKNIYCDGEIINKVGADRTVISHVELLKINWPVFKNALDTSKDIIFDEFKTNNRTCYVTEGGDAFHYMTITDPEIGYLYFGANPKRFGIMEFSPSNKRDGLNLVNFAGNELNEFLNNAVIMLYEKYGLAVSFSNCTFKETELNVTFALDHSFDDYYRPLSILFSGMPYLKTQRKYESKEKNEWNLSTHQAENKQVTVIAYNKSLEMEVKLKSDEKNSYL